MDDQAKLPHVEDDKKFNEAMKKKPRKFIGKTKVVVSVPMVVDVDIYTQGGVYQLERKKNGKKIMGEHAGILEAGKDFQKKWKAKS